MLVVDTMHQVHLLGLHVLLPAGKERISSGIILQANQPIFVELLRLVQLLKPGQLDLWRSHGSRITWRLRRGQEMVASLS